MKQGQETNQIRKHEAGTHDTRQNPDRIKLPPPGRHVPRRNSSTGEGGWALWRPLRTDMDRNTGRGPPERNRQRRPWRSWELRRPWRCRELRRPWRSWELWRPWWSWDLEAMAELGAQEAMADRLRGLGLSPLGPAPTAGTLLPPKKISMGQLGGIRSPPGLDTQNKTG